MVEQLHASFYYGPMSNWMMVLPNGASFVIAPGAGRMSRLGWITADTRPPAYFMVLSEHVQPPDKATNSSMPVDVLPICQVVADDEPANGELLFVSNRSVHMESPQFTEMELWELGHARHGHPATSVMVATQTRQRANSWPQLQENFTGYHQRSLVRRFLQRQRRALTP